MEFRGKCGREREVGCVCAIGSCWIVKLLSFEIGIYLFSCVPLVLEIFYFVI